MSRGSHEVAELGGAIAKRVKNGTHLTILISLVYFFSSLVSISLRELLNNLTSHAHILFAVICVSCQVALVWRFDQPVGNSPGLQPVPATVR